MRVLATQNFPREKAVNLIRERPKLKDCTDPSWELGELGRGSGLETLRIELTRKKFIALVW